MALTSSDYVSHGGPILVPAILEPILEAAVTDDLNSYPRLRNCQCGECLNRTVGEIKLDAHSTCPRCGRLHEWTLTDLDDLRANSAQRKKLIDEKRRKLV